MRKFLPFCLLVTFLGVTLYADTAVVRPNSDDGAVDGWSKSTGTTGHSLISEAVADDDATYIFSTSASNNHAFGFPSPNVPVGATAISVKVYMRWRMVAGGDGVEVQYKLKLGTSYEGGEIDSTSSTSYVNADSGTSFANNPATLAAWTVDEVNTTLNRFAFESRSMNGTTDAVRITQAYLEVTYTPAAGGSSVRCIVGGGIFRRGCG